MHFFTTESPEDTEKEEESSSLTGKIIGAAIVEDQVIVEIKSVSSLAAIHAAQLLSYLKLSDCKLGLLINFNVQYLKEGIRRMRS